MCHARDCMVGCMGRISHTNLKSYGDFQIRNFEKSHTKFSKTIGLRSDLRSDA
jgi:hypothetical protein